MSDATTKSVAADRVNIKMLINNEAANAAWQLLSVEIHIAFNKIASAKINIADGDASKQDFPLSSKEEKFLPGNSIELQMGYHDKTKTVFKGVIVKQAIKSGKNKTSFLSL